MKTSELPVQKDVQKYSVHLSRAKPKTPIFGDDNKKTEKLML